MIPDIGLTATWLALASGVGHLKGAQGVVRIGFDAVEIVLRVEEDNEVFGFEKGYRVLDHSQVLVQRGFEDTSHLVVPAFTDDGDHLDTGIDQGD